MMKRKSKKHNEILHEVDKLLENRKIDARFSENNIKNIITNANTF